jgi:hypothetical protein
MNGSPKIHSHARNPPMTWLKASELLKVIIKEGMRRNQIKRGWDMLDSCTKKEGEKTKWKNEEASLKLKEKP